MTAARAPSRTRRREAVAKAAHVSGMAAYDKLCAEAEADYEGYWARLARELVTWKTPFTQGARREQRAVLQVVRGRHAERLVQLPRPPGRGRPRRQGRDHLRGRRRQGDARSRYRELLARTCRLANALKARGVKKGDRVVIYMPMSIEGVVAMQACARIGATHSVVFGGFSAQSLRDRIDDAGAVMVITADEQVRGGKQLPLKAIVDEAIALGGCDSGARTSSSTGAPAATSRWNAPRDKLAARGDRRRSRRPASPNGSSAEHPLFLLYTSGSTGKPKGVQHSTGGYLLHAALTTKWTFDLKPDDVFWCTADIGWVTGHTYIAYGPLALGAHRDRVRRRADLSRRRPLLEDDPGPQGHDLLHRADGDPLADQGRRRQRDGASDATTTCRACASSARSASRSTRRPGSGTTSTSAAAAARSSTPSGRPRPAAT